MTPSRPFCLRPLCTALALAGLHLGAAALPRGGQVTHGTATVQTPTPSTLTVTQTSQNAAIDWLSFSIGAQERVNILQPSASAVLLNRVTGVDPSVILGRLSANGRVFLSNPRGILFGQGSQVDAGSLLATTLRLGDGPDAQGRWALTTPASSAPGSVTADGTISAPNGTIALVAPQVSVGGTLQGRRVGAAAAASVLVDVEGDGLIFFKVRNDEALDTRLDVLGTLRAEGGSADVRAQARSGFAGTVLNVDGLVQSRGLSRQGGEIMLDGGSAGVTAVRGTLDAASAEGSGGQITVLGHQVGLFDHALLDASGATGGGRVWVGGGWAGQGTATTAHQLFAGSDTTVRADALASGHGGTVVLWSEDATLSLGHLSARGGARSGDGGAVETSSHGRLGVGGRVDVRAAHGRAGQWLLDPASVTISNDQDSHLSETSFADDLFDDGFDANINIGTLEASLDDFVFVTVRTSGNGTGDGNISLLDALDLRGGTLNLVANGSIFLRGNITSSSTTGGNLVLLAGATDTANTDTAAQNPGTIELDAASSITLPSGRIGALARDNLTFLGPVVAGGPSAFASLAGAVTLSNPQNALSGNVTVGGASAVVTNSVDTTLELVVGGATTVDTGVANLTLSGTVFGPNATLNVASGALTLGTLGVAGPMNVAAGGTITQTGPLTVSGGLTIDAGGGDVLLTDAGNLFSSVGVIGAFDADVRSDAGFSITDSSALQTLAFSSNGDMQVSGTLSGTARLEKGGSGRLIVSTPQAYTGDTEVLSGTLQVTSGATLQTLFIALDPGATLAVGNAVVLPNTVVSDGGTILQPGGQGTLSGLVQLAGGTTTLAPAAGAVLALPNGVLANGNALQQTGAGTVALGGENGALGTLAVRAGTLAATTPTALATVDVLTVDAGAEVQLAGDSALGQLTGGGLLSLGSARVTVGADGSSSSFGGVIDGSGGLTKAGSGTFTLGGDNRYAGGTIVAAGTLATSAPGRLSDESALQVQAGGRVLLGGNETVGSLEGAGRIDLAGHWLAAGRDGRDTRFSGTMAGGALIKQGAGTLTLSGLNTLAGQGGLEGGTLRVAGDQALGGSMALQTAAGTTLDLQADATLGALTGAGSVTLAGSTLAIGAGNATMTFDGTIAGTGTLRKQGSGTATFSAASPLAGTLDVTGGTLRLQATWTGALDALVATPGVLQLGADQAFGTLSGNGGVNLGSATLTLGAGGQDSTFAGAFTGTGSLVKQGAGTLVLAGDSSFSGGTRVAAGTLQLGNGGSAGNAGTGAIVNDGLLRVQRGNELRLDAPVTGSGDLQVAQGTLTLGSAANAWSGTTTVSGGRLQTSGAERLPDGTTVDVAAGASLALGGHERLAAIDADGAVLTQGNVTTTGDQRYGGGLQIMGNRSVTLTGATLTADSELNQLGQGALGLAADIVSLRSGRSASTHADLRLGDVTLARGGSLLAGRLVLEGLVRVNGGALQLTADAVPDPARATSGGGAVVPGTGRPLVWKEDTIAQAAGSRIDLAESAGLIVIASGGGSVQLQQDGNHFGGGMAILSGSEFGTPWNPQVVNGVSPVSRVRVAGDQIIAAGPGFEADTLHLRADLVTTFDEAVLTARMPFDAATVATSLSVPSLTLELTDAAFGLQDPFGSADDGLRVSVGADGGAGYVAVLPRNGRDDTAVYLVGPEVGSGAPPYVFFFEGANSPSAIPVFYNGFLPETPQVTGALSSVDAVAEEARRERFEEAVRTENVTRRLRKGVIAEVGPGRPATEGAGGAAMPPVCTPADKDLQCAEDAR